MSPDTIMLLSCQFIHYISVLLI